MPTVSIHPLNANRSTSAGESALPQILTTPSGLAIVEIQGTVKFSTSTQSPQDGSTVASSPIGKLVFPHYDPSRPADDRSWHKRVHLYVGKHQRLTGEVKKLSNPIAVLRRKPDAGEQDVLEIAEIIYYKLLFAHRPEPVGGVDEE